MKFSKVKLVALALVVAGGASLVSAEAINPPSTPQTAPMNAQEKKNLDLVQRTREIAAAKGCTPSQLALAWVLAQGDDIVPIPGTKRRQYLEEDAQATEVHLTAEDLQTINDLSPRGAVSGGRYSEHAMTLIGR